MNYGYVEAPKYFIPKENCFFRFSIMPLSYICNDLLQYFGFKSMVLFNFILLAEGANMQYSDTQGWLLVLLLAVLRDIYRIPDIKYGLALSKTRPLPNVLSLSDPSEMVLENKGNHW